MKFIIKRKDVICYCLAILLSLFLFACSASKETKKEEKSASLQDYEKAFDPTKYGLDYYTETPLNVNNNAKTSGILRKNISGFRIQIVISKEFDECQRSRKELQNLFPDQKTYILHEFPFYKLRLGNFRTRQEAEDYQKNLFDKDIKNSQIVRDKIVVE
jgi:hypothetical protein